MRDDPRGTKHDADTEAIENAWFKKQESLHEAGECEKYCPLCEREKDEEDMGDK